MSNTTCFGGGNPVRLQQKAGCNLGFYCPNNQDGHPAEYCSPSTECQILRASGKVCEPQGIYEPVICTVGHYCPPPGKEQIRCPKGYFCPQGSFKPLKCSPAAVCPAGSSKKYDLTGLVFIILIDLAIMGFMVGPPLWKKIANISRRGRRMTDPEGERYKGTGASTPESAEYVELSPKDKAGGRGSAVFVDNIDNSEAEITDDLRLLIESFKKCNPGENNVGLTFDFQDMGFTVKGGRQLLSAVNGKIEAGTMWGVMGPSGAGKTTFMHVLMGKIEKSSGALFVNGVKKDMKEYKRLIGYVPQDDIIIPELTVRENILHSARIRLPSTWTEAEIDHHVTLVISCLSLTHVQHSLVGDAIRPVLSGGQRKRVNIGVELAAAPMCIFCDEPTSGLDATSAMAVVKLLHAISRLGVTVVSVIHQPRPEIYECLDNLLLISQGREVFHGPRPAMEEYLKAQGFIFGPTENPADVVMDIISGEGFRHRLIPRDNEVQGLIDSWDAKQPHPPIPVATDSSLLQNAAGIRGAHWWKQIMFCFLRSMTQQRHQISSLILEIFVGGLAGGLIGLAVMKAKGELFRGINLPPFELLSVSIHVNLIPEICLMMGLAIGLAGAPSGVKVFGDEKLIYWREAASGHSRWAYYIGKVLSTFPRIALSSLHFSVFLTILATPVMSFSKAYLTIFLDFFCIYGLASMVSMVTTKENGALLSVVTAMLTSTFCGYGPSLKQAQEWKLDWWWRMCPGTWFAEAWYEEGLRPYAHVYDIQGGADEMGYKLGWFRWDCLAMVVVGVVYRIIAYGGLVGLERGRQR